MLFDLENGAHLAGYETTITQTRRKWHGDTSTPKKVEQSTAVDHNLIPKPNQGCGSTEQVEPMQLPGKPGTPLVPEQNPGYPGVPLVPDKPIGGYALPVEKSEPLINVPVETDWRDNVLTKDNKNDTVPKVKQYDGPKYIRTEDWVESLPAEVKKHAIRTKEINKKKRVFQFEKEYGDIGKKDKVAVDSVHYDHLEVFDSTGTVWKFAANFDGTKNIEKTNQVKKPREIKS